MSKTLGQRIRRARDREGLTQADLADKVGVTPAAVSNWEAGGEPKGINRTRLEEVLGLLSTPKPSRKPKTLDNEEPALLENEVSSFGVWLRNQRVAASLSVPELAKKSRVSSPALYNIESGKIQNPQPATRDKLTKALGQIVPLEVVNETESEQAIAGLGNLTDFDPYATADWPSCSGVYVFYDISQRPIYVGKAGNISKRLRNHSICFGLKIQ